MDQLTPDQMTALFGVAAGSLEERAKLSTQLFVRSQDSLAFHSHEATGVVLTAIQVCEFPAATLVQILEYGSAVLPDSKEEPARTIREQREFLGLSIAEVGRAAGLKERVVEAAESSKTSSSIHDLTKIARALALDESKLTVVPGAGADLALAVRLRAKDVHLTPQAVIDLSEAAWVIRQQAALHPLDGLHDIKPSGNYGSPGYPAWLHGQYLARHTRQLLGLGAKPIQSMHELIEGLGVPVVQLAMRKRIAGATIAVHHARGIVANLDGDNSNPKVRRFTLAHELGHLLWDPPAQLRSLRVDSYDEINELSAKPEGLDPVESRANGFAIELLAPAAEVVEIFNRVGSADKAVLAVMEKFGVSFTAAQHQVRNSVRNVLGKDLSFGAAPSSKDTSPNEWNAAEDPAYFPIKGTRDSRRGDFAREVVKAEGARRIHESVAATWLGTTVEEYQEKKADILALGR